MDEDILEPEEIEIADEEAEEFEEPEEEVVPDEEEEVVEEQAEIEFMEIESQRTRTHDSRHILFYDGYEYCFEKPSKTFEEYDSYKCVKRRPYCGGRILARQNVIQRDGLYWRTGRIVNGHHNHPKNETILAVGKLNYSIKNDFSATRHCTIVKR
jgi:hypothetical protein